MKGTPQFPQCGFSARAVEALSQIGRPFAYVNILENQDIRATLPQIANWPTFPINYGSMASQILVAAISCLKCSKW